VQFPITIGLRRSFLIWLLPLLGLVASFILLMLPLAANIRGWMVSVSLLGLTGLIWQKNHSCRIQTLRLSADGSMSVAFAGTADYFVPVILQLGATVHPWLTVMRLQAGKKVYRAVLTPESIDRDDFRRLRVFLRWAAKFNEPDAGL